MADTGHGATIAFGTSTFSASVRRIGSYTMSRPSIDSSHLATTNFRTFIPGDLVDAGSFEIEYLWLADTNKQAPVTAAAAETITITLPEYTAVGNAGTIAGSGFVTDVTSPELLTDQLMTATATIKWSGEPVLTAETNA